MPRGNKNSFIKFGHFVCECGREFEKSQSLYSHQGKCKIHLGERYDPEIHKGWNVGESRAWMKGKTIDDPEYGDQIKRFVYSGSHNKGKSVTIHDTGKFLRQSETRKRKYASGELTPAKGVGRGKYSYLTYNGNTILLRSTYEFIYALYLLYSGIEFSYESVRVTTDDRTFISDFLIGGKVVEIKGNYHADTSKQREAFESQGYSYEVKFWKDLSECYEFLKSKIDIDQILDKIKEGHDSRNYYEYIFS